MTTSDRTARTFPERVAVAGSSSTAGALLMAHLELAWPDCWFVPIDTQPLRWPVKRVSAYRMDRRDRGETFHIDNIPEVMQAKAFDELVEARRLTMADIADTLDLERVDAVIHVGSHYDGPDREQFLNNAAHWIRSCRMAAVRQLVYLSDVRVYGAGSANPIPLTERSRPGPASEHQVLLDAESALLDHSIEPSSDADLRVAVLRSAMSVGPISSSPVADELLWPAVTSHRNRSIPIQLVHQHDLMRAVQFALFHQLHGVYNVASRGIVGSKDVLDMFQKGTTFKAHRSKRYGRSVTRGMGKHPLIVSDAKFRQAAKFEAKYSSEQAARAYCHSYLLGTNPRHDRQDQE